MVSNNSHYWVGKNERSEKAAEHVKNMDQLYKESIERSVQNTKVYDSFTLDGTGRNHIPKSIHIEPTDSVSAILKYANGTYGRVAVLNFASFHNPGGKFLEGSKAQEECLCHESTLYNVLNQHRGFYETNGKHKNRNLYSNRALYSPEITFLRDSQICSCDVITCASPNRSAAERIGVTEAENSNALRSRIRFVLGIAEDNKVDTLILGAYGCGVFGQDPKEVASIFKEELMDPENHYGFTNVIFAIIPGLYGNMAQNLIAFTETFKRV